MEAFFASLETLAPFAALRFSRWAYAAVNTGHVFGIALLVGGALPLSLRLFGLWPAVPRAGVVRILALSAGIGLGLALMSGALLFATRASEYSAIWAFQIKMLFVFIGAGSALFAHGHYGWVLERAPDRALRRIAIVSCICWTGALVSGRLIAFVTG